MRSNRGTHHKSASAPRDDPATEKNANGENAASGEIEPSRTSSFRQHRSSIERQKQQNSSCVSEWESWCDNSSYNSASDTREHRANCSKNHLARVRIDCHLTHQDVERENCSGGNNQISTDNCGDAAKSEKKSVRHRTFYLIPRLWHRGDLPTLLSPLLRAALSASDSRGRPIGRLSHGGFSRCLELRARPDPATSTRHIERRLARQGIRERDACSQTANEKLSPGWRLFHVRVKDRLPFTLSLLFLPDGGGVVGTGLVLPIV